MSYALQDFGETLEGEEFPAFREPVGVNTDAIFLGVNVGKWLAGRPLISAEVVAEDSEVLTIDSVSYQDELIAFRVASNTIGNHKVKITARVLNAKVTRTRIIQVEAL